MSYSGINLTVSIISNRKFDEKYFETGGTIRKITSPVNIANWPLFLEFLVHCS